MQETMAATTEKTATSLGSWLGDRLGLESIREFIAHKSVPKHSATMWYYFGGITLFLFVIQVLTGILLLLYYRPTTAEAYESVQFIVTRVKFGWLVRSVHSWSANLMILTAFIHMFSVVFLHAYRKPRELTWLSGICCWDWLWVSGSAATSCLGIPFPTSLRRSAPTWPGSLPVIGPPMARFLRGGEEVAGRRSLASSASMWRFYRDSQRLSCCSIWR